MAERPRSSSAILALAVLALGAASVVLLLGTDQIRRRSAARDVARVRAASEIQAQAALSHLWLEEKVSGDQVETERVIGGLDRSLRLVRAMRGERVVGLDLESPSDPRMLRMARILEQAVEEFRQLSVERLRGYELGLPVGIGSERDVEYDASFNRLLNTARNFEEQLEFSRETNAARSALHLNWILAGWVLLIAASAAGLWRWGRRRDQAETALAHSREQLLHSQKMEAVGRLAGGLAHDINNYLAAIRGHCELVRMRHPEPEDPVGRKMDAALRIIGKASDLLERLLTIGHRRPLRRQVLSVDRLLRELDGVIRSSAGEAIRVEIDLDPAAGKVEGDRGQLEQVVLNLVVNARDAMTSGGFLAVRTREEVADSGRWAVLEVEDSGEGIAPDLLDRIFEPFVTSKHKAGSSGLGLAIVYGVVEGHGGRIEVESEVGRGTVFRVRLPQTSLPLPEATDPGIATADPGGGTERILLVDDNDEFREATRELLEMRGYRVEALASGREALDRFLATEYDLVLIDVVMPEIDGPELAARLRAIRPARIAFLTGQAGAPALGSLDGMDLLPKLLTPRELAGHLRRILDSAP